MGIISIVHNIAYYAGENTSHWRRGVAIIVPQKITKAVKNEMLFSEEIAMLQLETDIINLNIESAQLYIPSCGYDDEKVEQFYYDLEYVLSSTKEHEMSMIMCDLNAKVGEWQVVME